MSKKQTIMSYGSVNLLSATCPKCKSKSFIIDSKYQCCNTPFTKSEIKAEIVRVSAAVKRRPIPTKTQRRILDEQQHSCFYCNACFGLAYELRGKQIVLTPEFDHIMPVAYLADNNYENIVAACQVCNRLKSAKIFDSIQDIKDYLEEGRERRGYNF